MPLDDRLGGDRLLAGHVVGNDRTEHREPPLITARHQVTSRLHHKFTEVDANPGQTGTECDGLPLSS